MLVIDASTAVRACSADDGFARFGDEELVAPPLLWSEVSSVLHRAVHRGLASRENGLGALDRLEHGPVQMRNPARLGFEAWRIADRFGWAKTYDAEYLALALLERSRLTTFDRRLERAAERLGVRIVLPSS